MPNNESSSRVASAWPRRGVLALMMNSIRVTSFSEEEKMKGGKRLALVIMKSAYR